MIALPGDKYYEVPRKVLEKYAVTKAAFEKDLQSAWKQQNTVFHSEVEGQQFLPGTKTPTSVLGIRG
jgi:hypothetical protein